MADHTVLILGGPKSGKTHYGAQLTIRLTKKKGALKFFAPPENLEIFQGPIEALGRGRLAEHTPVAVSKDVILPIELSDNRQVRVVWPDYGGEQVQQMLRRRIVPATWKERVTKSDGWLVMLRPELFRPSRDLLHRPLKDFEPKTQPTAALPEWMPEPALIELLQMLLFVRGCGREGLIKIPKLVIAITCWDEAHNGTATPVEELRTVAPMLANFLDGSWHGSRLTTVGISALGKALSADKNDEEFIDQGPHRQGFVVLPDGTKTDDLTWPLKMLLI